MSSKSKEILHFLRSLVSKSKKKKSLPCFLYFNARISLHLRESLTYHIAEFSKLCNWECRGFPFGVLLSQGSLDVGVYELIRVDTSVWGWRKRKEDLVVDCRVSEEKGEQGEQGRLSHGAHALSDLLRERS